jgi:linoleoyl-CoA desaturase
MSATEAASAAQAAHDTDVENPLERLSPEQLEQFTAELDAIRDEVFADLGERDARYIRQIIRSQRQLAIAARVLLLGSRRKSLWITGTTALSLAKILENLEIGHNLLHGQWDWMNDPDIDSQTWDWDTASPGAAWRHAHNYVHHVYAQVRGKDRDLGYTLLRVDPEQEWKPIFFLQPLYNLLLMALFEWGVALYDLNTPAMLSGEKPREQYFGELKAIGAKARRQIIKDYIAFPLLARATTRSRASFKSTLAANFTANVVRNAWAHSVIFCGHFTEETFTFSEQEIAGETRGEWYVRQLLGAANFEGSVLFHILGGHTGLQIEHHLFPDMPSNRLREVAPRVREICERYGLPYNNGPFSRQLASVHRTILRYALPGGKPRPKLKPHAEPPAERGANARWGVVPAPTERTHIWRELTPR